MLQRRFDGPKIKLSVVGMEYGILSRDHTRNANAPQAARISSCSPS